MAADAEVSLRVTGEDAGGVEVLEDVGSAAVRAKKQVDDLGDSDGLDELSRDAEESVKAFRKAERAFESAVDKFRTAKLSPAFQEGSKAARRLREEVVKTGRRLNDLAKEVPPELRRVGRGFEDVEKRVKAARRQLTLFAKGTRRIDSVVKSVTSLRTAVGALQAAFALAIAERFVTGLARTAAEAVRLKTSIDLLTPALKSNLGSSDAAAKGQEFLRTESERLAVTIDSLAGNYVQLTAATKGTVIAGAETDRLFSSITEAARVLGKSNEDVSRAFLGLSQAAGGANVQMQEVRQITEAIPGLFAAWAAELNLTQTELRGLIAEGNLAADQLGTLADAAEALAGDTALQEQLSTTAGLFQRLEVAVQNAQVALATELEPGLRDALKVLLEQDQAVKVLAASLGEILSGEFREAAASAKFFVSVLTNEVEILEKVFGEGFTEILGLDRLRDDLEGVPAAAREAFDELESAALQAAGAVQEGSKSTEILADSFGELPEAAKRAFRETSAAARIDAGEREKIAVKLAEDVAKITEKSVKLRGLLEKASVEAARRGGDEEIAIRREVAESERQIAERALAATRQALAARVAEARKAADEEKRLNQERIKDFDVFARKAAETESKRLEAQTAASEDIEELDRQLAAKRLKLQEEFVEAHGVAEEKRAAAVAAVEAKVVDFARESAQKRRDLEQKAADERVAIAEKEAEEKKRIEKKLRDDLAGIAEAAKAPDAPSAGGEVDLTTGPGIAATRQGIDDLGQSVDALREKLDELLDVGSQAPIDPDAILQTARALDDAKLGVSQFAEAAQQGAEQSGAAAEEIVARFQTVVEKIAEVLESEETLASLRTESSAGFIEALSGQVEALTNLVEAGVTPTNEEVTALAETFAAFTGETAPASVDASTSIQEALASLTKETDQSKKSTEGQTKATEAQVEAVTNAEGEITILQKAREKLADTEDKSTKFTEDVSEATQEAGDAAGEAAGPVGELADQMGRAGEESGAAATNLKDAAAAADELSSTQPPTGLVEGIQAISDASATAAATLGTVRDRVEEIVAKTEAINAQAAAVKSLARSWDDVAESALRAAEAEERAASAAASVGE